MCKCFSARGLILVSSLSRFAGDCGHLRFTEPFFLRRSGRNNWGLVSSQGSAKDATENPRGFWGVLSRNFDRASRRWQRSQASPVASRDGATIQYPPDDESAPDLPQGTLSHHIPRLALFGPRRTLKARRMWTCAPRAV